MLEPTTTLANLSVPLGLSFMIHLLSTAHDGVDSTKNTKQKKESKYSSKMKGTVNKSSKKAKFKLRSRRVLV